MTTPSLRETCAYAPLYYDLGPFKTLLNGTPPIAKAWSKTLGEHPPVVCVVTTAPKVYDAAFARLGAAEGHDVVLQVICEGVPMLVGKLGNYQVTLVQIHEGNDTTKEVLLRVLPSLSSVRLVLAVGSAMD